MNMIECTGCKALLDAFTSADEGSNSLPNDEDLSVCVYCGAVGKYIEGTTKIKPLSEVELAYIKLTEPELAMELDKISVAVLMMKKAKNN